MQVLVRTDNHIDSSQNFADKIEAQLQAALERYKTRITRVEVHLSDVNSNTKSGVDKRCMLEARLGGLEPMVVEERAEDLDLAISNAIDTLERQIGRTLEKLDHSSKKTSFSGVRPRTGKGEMPPPAAEEISD